ncbi:tyrosine-type recombinase/integrase [Paracoccus ravus]|uniref:tyrosine-type recombinase/integrase n=1 Tax=Paracoccus ravus TaxID=2447760 RepID=UPI00142F4E16|nr:tyrosine-type recombinase/integrase [Paracoccus ravus]
MRKDGSFASLVEAGAILGAVEAPAVTLSGALAEMIQFAAVERLSGKSEAQVSRWRTTRDRAVANFVKVCGDLPMKEISRANAQAYREAWAARIKAGEVGPNSANKDIGTISDLFRTWAEYHALELPNPFAKLRFKGVKTKTKGVPFSVQFIRDKLLRPGALARMNDEARDVLLIMVNTGARPSEIVGLTAEGFALGANVPHIDISKQAGRVLKTQTSPRQIPLLGVSLEAARRIVARGGIARYRDRADTWSAVVNKFLSENGLRETPEHSAYSLRHSFEDRLTEAGVDDRIRAELMGHKYERPDYGRGGSLELRRKALALIAL